MASAPSQRSHGPKGSYRNQKRFVPKGENSSSSSRDHPIPGNAKPPPPLTTALRGSSAAPARPGGKGRRGGGGNFVRYLPQDEAVACGLGADAGGLDAVESQGIVDLLNDELSKLLKMSPRDFWREVATNDSLHDFLDSYLQFRHRWYDFPHRGARGIVAGVIVGELELCRRVFMVLYRISSNKDPGACANECLSMKEHTALLQEKKLLDLPKLLDICAIYGHDNEELTRLLVTNAFKAQPKLLDNVSSVVTHFLNIVHTMHQRCSSSLEVLIASRGREVCGYGHLYEDFLEVVDFINDAIVTLDAFAHAYKPASLYFSIPFEMSYGNEELLSTLARLHDSLLPSLQQGFKLVSSYVPDRKQNLSAGLVQDIVLSLKMLSVRVVKFGWKLLDFCYLNDQLTDDSLLQTAMKMFPAKVEDPVIRGDILVQTFKEINGEVSIPYEKYHSGTFLRNLEKDFKILGQIQGLRNTGWIFMDDEQFQYLSQIAAPATTVSWNKEPEIPISLLNDTAQTDEEAVIHDSKISQIKDLFPDYGKGFLSACLEVYNHDPEEVIQRILEGTLHEDLSSLDTSLEKILPLKSATQKKSDKGKEVLLESASRTSVSPAKVDSKMPRKDEDGPSSSVSSYGRYTRKSNNDLPDTAVLDSRTDKDAVRSSVLAAEYEYEDEYDDSFDDLVLSVVEAGYEEADNLSNRNSSLSERSSGSEVETSSRNSTSKWSSQKKPQFYVKDGKNYSYKVSGSVGVSNAQEAAVLNYAQKEIIHGLGRGGNLPVGAVKKLMDAEEQDHPISDAAESLGRGNPNPRGRGGRRGGGNHHRKDRAMKKHFTGLVGS
ncbi:activating signal cointegrator 1 complex subunit 2 [Phoenix dactylifera]|uniref:Activating signal cointegrator 1 complex subunit 2 n=1 Tax=Phoenix dactylifera TaxID=42345 RepID=A0A8B7CSV3_PHODC|nr:activating signal cointegrator 1 complex subunit 2 [Phoenix dactylifera]